MRRPPPLSINERTSGEPSGFRTNLEASRSIGLLDDKIFLECREAARAAGRRRLRWLDLAAVDRIRRDVFPSSVVEAFRESLALLTSVVD